jgi:hypothetical protein
MVRRSTWIGGEELSLALISDLYFLPVAMRSRREVCRQTFARAMEPSRPIPC